MKEFKSDSTSALARFGRDKRERTTTATTERVERRPRPQRDAADAEQPSSRQKPEGRTSYNPNFTADNRFAGDRKPGYGDKPRSERGGGRSYGDKPSYGNKPYGAKPAYGNKPRYDENRGEGREERDFNRKPSYGDKPRYNDKPAYGDKPRFEKSEGRGSGDKPSYGNKPYGSKPAYGSKPRYDENRGDGREERDFNRKPSYGDKPRYNDKPAYGDKPRFEKSEGRGYGDKPSYGKKPYGSKPAFGAKSYGDRKPHFNDNGSDERRSFGDKPTYGDKPRYGSKPAYGDRSKSGAKPIGDRNSFRPRSGNPDTYPRYNPNTQTGEIRLNRFIAQSGVCSRREADDYITAGVVSVNGVIITELGTKVMPNDEVKFNDSRVQGEKKVYLVMNKPKGYVTTLEDPHATKTVMDLVRDACAERIYPVGRLDKNSLGLLLFTNDGDLTKQLTHPSYKKKKIYQVRLDKPLTRADMDAIASGITLEDGEIYADEISYVKEDKQEIGIEIHSGRNRIVRRIFEHLGYTVNKLDRVYYAGLTKKNLNRGAWRFLSNDEVIRLKSGQYE